MMNNSKQASAPAGMAWYRHRQPEPQSPVGRVRETLACRVICGNMLALIAVVLVLACPGAVLSGAADTPESILSAMPELHISCQI